MTAMRNNATKISAVVLAGGRARRMDGVDKGLVMFRGQPLCAQVCKSLHPQVDELLINANRNLEIYKKLGYKVIKDELTDHQGPLAGMLVALRQIKYQWLLTLPCDAPFVANDYATRMLQAATANNTSIAVAHSGERLQPVHALIHRDHANNLGEFLNCGERKIDRWYAQHNFAAVDFSDQPKIFVNINTAEQLSALE